MHTLVAGLVMLFVISGAIVSEAIKANPNQPWVARLDTTIQVSGARGIVVASTGDFATMEAGLKLPCRGQLPPQDLREISKLVGEAISRGSGTNSGYSRCTDQPMYMLKIRWVDDTGALRQNVTITPPISDICQNKESVPRLLYNLIERLLDLRNRIAPHCTLSILPER
jgi:hypothetical protein